MRYMHSLHAFIAAVGLVAAMADKPATTQPAPVDTLKDRLTAAKPADRERALAELATLGPAAGPAVPEIAKLLEDKDPRVRNEALLCIERIGPAAGAAVVHLGKILKEGPPAMTLGAIHALGAIGPEADPTVPDLLRLSDGNDDMLATAAVAALMHIRPGDKKQLERVVPVLMKSLASPQVQVRNDAMNGLSDLGPSSVPALTRAVENHAADPALAARAAAVLATIGDAAVPARAALLSALTSKNEKLQEPVARALAAVAAADPDSAPAVVAELHGLLSSKIGPVRATALRALGKVGPAAALSVPAIAERLKDTDPSVRREAASTLGGIGLKAEAAVPALVAALGDANGTVTLHAATSLGRRGEPAAAEPLARRLQGKDHSLKPLVISILAQLGPDAAAAVPQLVDLLQSDDPELLRSVHIALGRIGPAAAPAIPALLATVGDPSSKLRTSAVFALAKIGAKDELLPMVAKTVADKEDEHLQNISAWALVTLDPENADYAKVSLPRLINGLADNWSLVRWESAIALGKLRAAAEPAVPALVNAYATEKDPEIRNEIIVALGEIGPAAKAGVPAVLQGLADSSASVRYSACYAAGRMGAAAHSALPVLKNNLSGKDAFLTFMSAWAMANIAPKEIGLADDVLPALKDGLKFQNPQARLEAIQALTVLGPQARRALPDLKSIEPTDEETREALKKAIAAIEG